MKEEAKRAAGQLVQKEERKHGKVDPSVYYRCLTAAVPVENPLLQL